MDYCTAFYAKDSIVLVLLKIRVISGGNDIQLLVGQMPMGPKGFLGLAKRDAERSKFNRLCH